MKIILTLFALIGLAIAACSSSSGNKEKDSNNTASIPSGLSGQVVFSGSGSVVRFINLANGQYSQMQSSFNLIPSFDGSEWAAFDTQRRLSDGEDDLVFLNRSGSVISRSAVNRSLHGSALPSPDKTKIALFWANEDAGESFTRPSLTIFSRTGQVIARDSLATAAAWAPNGDIIVAEGNRIFRANSSGTSSTQILQVARSVNTMSVSREGNKLAFSMAGTANNEFHLWVVNLDGTGLRQLTTSSVNEMDPSWLPGGQYLIARQNVDADVQGFNDCPDLYLVPTTRSNIITLSRSNTDAHLISYADRFGTHLGSCPLSRPFWTN